MIPSVIARKLDEGLNAEIAGRICICIIDNPLLQNIIPFNVFFFIFTIFISNVPPNPIISTSYLSFSLTAPTDSSKLSIYQTDISKEIIEDDDSSDSDDKMTDARKKKKKDDKEKDKKKGNIR